MEKAEELEEQEEQEEEENVAAWTERTGLSHVGFVN